MGKPGKGAAAAVNPAFETGLLDVEPWPLDSEYQVDAEADENENAAEENASASEVCENDAQDCEIQNDTRDGLLPAINLPLWQDPEAQHASFVSKLQSLGADVEWLPIDEVVAESVLHDEEFAPASWSVLRLHGGSEVFRSTLGILCNETLDIGEDRCPWKRVESREVPAPSDDDPQPRPRFAVQLYLDGDLREVIVDDLVPVRNGVIQLAHELIELPAQEVEVSPTDPQASEEDNGAESEPPAPAPARFKAILWPLLLEKATMWVQEQSTSANLGRAHPLSLLGPCFALTMPEGRVANIVQATPQEADWTHLRRPSSEDFVFESWDAWMRAKADAKSAGDEDALATLEAAGEAAKEKKRQLLASKLATSNEPADAESTQESGAVLETPKKEKKQKRRKKTKRRRSSDDDIIPVDTIAFNAAMKAHEDALTAAVASLHERRRTFEVLRATGGVLRAKLCVSRGRVTSDDSGAAAQGDAAPPDTSEADAATKQPLTESEMLMEENLLGLAAGVWKEVELEVRADQMFIVIEAGASRIRVAGYPQILSPMPKNSDGRAAHTFWVSRTDLDAVSATFETWRFVDPLQDACRIDYNAGEDGAWSAQDLGRAFIAPPTSAEAEDSAAEDMTLEFTLMLACKSGPLDEVAELEVATYSSGVVAIDQDLLAAFETPRRPDVEATTEIYRVEIAQGLACFSLPLSPNAIHVFRLHSPTGALVRIVGNLSSMAPPLVLGALDAWKEMRTRCEGPSATELVTSETLEISCTRPEDWQCIARYRVDLGGQDEVQAGNKDDKEEEEEEEKETGAATTPQLPSFCASVDFSNRVHRDYLQIWEVDTESGKHVRRDKLGMWVPPCKRSSSTFDLIFLMVSPKLDNVPSASCQISLACATGIKSAQRLTTAIASLRRGTYVPNNRGILFREYFDAIPQVLTFRVDVGQSDLPFKVQLISQDVAAQLESRTLGSDTDEIIAETYSTTAENASVPGVVELHAFRPDTFDQVRASSERRLVLQAALLDGELFGRAPYWTEAQYPDGYTPVPDNTNQTSDAEHEVAFRIRTISDVPFELMRESTWESALLKEQAQWEVEEPGRAERAKLLRESFLAGFFPLEDTTNGDTIVEDEEKAIDAAEGEMSEETTREKARLAARHKLAHKRDEKGQVFWRRCPIPANDEDEFLLDEYKAREDVEVIEENTLENCRAKQADWYKNLTQAMSQTDDQAP
ncbi:Hypothetical Protein FCC1311_036242 [Hondaea fermentalgiana]|uniref:Uncharacterized protein n=1 Tax=Hondaea fermentalgiana TaxID=2315210 RepID=A0A2R5G8M4_9STRA|nr:Hypothetical Protein FCC1311_036242 [Hondaea fermentalgiana]|eukprot:GBG27402.1 Hypothetical Protein FCC1311_036242 [Hondaea fermentalgiana]